ncbi:MAG: CCA tRNA nucleotidyltransferase [Chloroflexota bacterium]|nr:CCA tRNA nucleotidyltransferase [Chloroflexota bacterium]
MFPSLLTEADNFLDRLSLAARRQGYSLFLVGGSVRDALMSRPTHDLDLTTDAPVEAIKAMLEESGAGVVYGLGEKFGTIAAQVGDATVEVTTFRNRAEASPNDPLSALHTDLAHRDFTMNAMARDLATGELHDPYDGQINIKQHLVRAVGDPEERFAEDPLRLLRAVRFAATFSFFIERETAEAIRKLAPLLEDVSRERVGDEMDRLLLADPPSEGIGLLDNLGLLEYTVPELLEMHEMERGPLHYKEVYPHTLKVVDRTAPDLVLRWAALLHDIAKPQTYGITDGEVHFFGHEKLGAQMAKRILTRLRRPHEVVEQVEQLVAEHLRIGLYDEGWSDGAVRRFLRETAPINERLFALSRADITSQRPFRVAAALSRIDALYERCEQIKAQEEVEKITSPLDGNEIMQLFGGKPGRWIGEVKDYLLGLVLDGVLAQDDKEGAERLAREYLAEHQKIHPGAV